MSRDKVEKIELVPSINLYWPSHKSGVMSAIKDFCKGKRPRVRKRGIAGRPGQRKRSTARLVRSNNGDMGKRS